MRKSICGAGVFVLLLAFLTSAQAQEVAIYTGNVGWIDKGSADAQSQICADNLNAAGITATRFTNAADDGAVASWVTSHTANGQFDVLVLYGWVPTTIYPQGNTQADGSIAELFIESTDGDMILNHADYMFYVSGVVNGEGGIRNIMDNTAITMWDDNTALTITAEGGSIAPSMDAGIGDSDRPFHLNELAGEWYVEVSLRQNGAAGTSTRADPCIVRDGNRGRLAIAYQNPDVPGAPRGAVAAEMITYLIDREASQLALSGPATTVEGTPVKYTVKLLDDLGVLTPSASPVTVNLTTDSGTGKFDTSRKGTFSGSVTSVTIPAGSVTATFYYKDTTANMATLGVSATGLASASMEVNVLEAVAADPGEVAIYTGNTNWLSGDPAVDPEPGRQIAAAEAQIMVDRLGLLTVTNEVFGVGGETDLEAWVTEHTDNGALDVLVIFGFIPDNILPDATPDGSIAELFIESTDGDTIINFADYMFYVNDVPRASDLGPAGLQNMMDILDITMWDDHIVTVTPDGKDISPSVADYAQYFWTNRPFHTDQLSGTEWFVEATLAENPAGNRADPIIVRDGNRGRLVPVFQAANRTDPKGAVGTEIIAWLYGINVTNPVKLGFVGRTTVMVGQPLRLTVQRQSFLGSPAPAAAPVTVNLTSGSATGKFDTAITGSFDGSVTSVTIPADEASALIFFKDTAAGTPTLTAAAAGLTSGTVQVNVNARQFSPEGEVAIYTGATNPDWASKAMADEQTAILTGRLDDVGILSTVFPTATADDTQALKLWVQSATNNGFLDVLVLYGVLPTALYPVGNTQPNFSPMERFIESQDGDAVINLGDWMFYCDYDAAGVRTDNGPAGLQNIMDIPAVTMAGYDNTLMTVTPEGKAIAPNLNDFLTDRPFHLDSLAGNWLVEVSLAQSADGMLADPVMVRDGSRGRLIPVFQTAAQNDPKGAVAAEIIASLMRKTLKATGLGLYGNAVVLAGKPYTVSVRLQDSGGAPYPAASAITVSLAKDSATGAFDTAKDGPFNGTVTSVTILAGQSSATFYYKDPTAGLVTLSATAADLDPADLQVNVLPDVPVEQGEVAIYTGNTSWIAKDLADAEAQTCATALTTAGITSQVFASDQDVDALATWVNEHTDNGKLDVLVLYGFLPGSIYPSGNTQPNGSIAELFIESTDGDAILNQADWMFYVSNPNNAEAGLQNMMDITGVTMAGYDNTPMTVTAEAATIAPTLVDFQTDRPLHLDTLAGNWWVEATLAQGANPMLAEPVIVRDGNLGRLIPVYQTADQADPKGQVAAEIITWLMENTQGGGKPKFRRGDSDGKGGVPNITDGIYVLNFLFLGGPEPPCYEAANADDKGGINITDGIYILNYLFQGGPEPPAPGPNACGEEPAGSQDNVGCVNSTADCKAP